MNIKIINFLSFLTTSVNVRIAADQAIYWENFDNQGFGCTGCKNFWSTSVNVVVYLGSSYFTIFLLCVEVDTILYQLVIMSHTFQMFCFVNL